MGHHTILPRALLRPAHFGPAYSLWAKRKAEFESRVRRYADRAELGPKQRRRLRAAEYRLRRATEQRDRLAHLGSLTTRNILNSLKETSLWNHLLVPAKNRP